MTDDEEFDELMRRSSLGSRGARHTLERVPPEQADTVRRITQLRNTIMHSSSTAWTLEATRELVDLLRARGFAWRDEIPDDLLLWALNNAPQPVEPHLPAEAKSASEEEPREVDQLVDRLPPPLSRALKLFLDGQSTPEIAEQLHLSTDDVSRHIRLGLMACTRRWPMTKP